MTKSATQAYRHAYYVLHRKEIARKRKKYIRENPTPKAVHNERCRRYRRKNKELIREYNRQYQLRYRRKNKELIREYNRQYQLRYLQDPINHEKHKQRCRDYWDRKLATPEARAEHNRQARKKYWERKRQKDN